MLVLTIFLLIRLRQISSQQIDFAMKREGYEMSFDTMVLTGDNAANPDAFQQLIRLKMMLFSSLTWVFWSMAVRQI